MVNWLTRKLTLAAVSILAFVAAGLGGCELPVAGGGAIYAAFHKPDPLTSAYVSLRRHDCSAANSEFSDFLEATPNDARAISGRADARVCLGKYDDAIADYSRAIQLDPKWFDYLGRGVAWKAKGNQTGALDNFNAGIALAPTVPGLYVYRGAILSARGDASGASADFAKVTSLVSDSRRAFNRYGWTLATSSIVAYRDGPAAIQYSTRACELTSWKKAPELDTLAAAYAETGQFDEAVKWQISALNLCDKVDRDEYEARLAMYQKREPYRSEDTAAGFF
jgi:tetratricopeptide (TPR) repeat protein